MSEAEAPASENPLLLAGNRSASLFGYLFGIFGLVLVAFDRRLHWGTGNTYVFTDQFQIPFAFLGIVVATVGIASFLGFKWFPRKKTTAWKHLDRDALGTQWIVNDLMIHVASGIMPLALILLAWTYHQEPSGFLALLIMAWATFGASLAMILWSAGRNGLLRRLLAVELGTSYEAPSTKAPENQQETPDTTPEWAETTPSNQEPTANPESVSKVKEENQSLAANLSGPDPRLKVVLPALDELLSEISDESLAKFKGTEAATLYVEILEEVL